MTSLSDDLRDFFSNPKNVDILLNKLNTKIARCCPRIESLQEKFEKKILKTRQFTFNDLGKEFKNEVYVYLGRALEDYSVILLADQFYVEEVNSSDGDLIIGNNLQRLLWELKGTSQTDSWTGSTHATRKEDKPMNFLGFGYNINKEANLFDLIDGNVRLIDELFIGVFENLTLVRHGEASESSSRTKLRIPVADYDVVKKQVAWGNFRQFRKNQTYLHFETAA